jgi:hypothetical protein
MTLDRIILVYQDAASAEKMEWILTRAFSVDGIHGPFGTREEATCSLDPFWDAPDDAHRLEQAKVKLLAWKT